MFGVKKVIETQDKTIERLTDVIDTMAQVERLAEAWVKVARLEGELALKDERIKSLTKELSLLQSFRPSSTPLYYTEEEEDAKFLLDRGLIDNKEYQDILAAAGFENTAIEIAT